MDEDVGLLSLRLVKSKNFLKCKKNVDELMYKFEECRFRFHNLKPPKITPNYEIKYEMTTQGISNPTADYVQKKIENEEELDRFYYELSKALEGLCKSELLYFKNAYYNRLSEELICDLLNVGKDMLRRIKESAVIKVSMYFNIDVNKK